jgi:hypothetical protein
MGLTIPQALLASGDQVIQWGAAAGMVSLTPQKRPRHSATGSSEHARPIRIL